MKEIELSKRDIVNQVEALLSKVKELGQERSTLLKIAEESFALSSDAHLNSLNPEIREQLGLHLSYLTQGDPQLQREYVEKKNKYLSLGKSYAAIRCLFDLVEEEFSLLDLLLFHELLMDDGQFRSHEVFIEYPEGGKVTYGFETIEEDIEKVFAWYEGVRQLPEISPIVIAVLFHHKIVAIHPFTDGNGRVSRLVLNLMLLKKGIFPISIPNEKRKEYYESLVLADKEQFEPIVDFFGTLILEKLQQYLVIAKELEDLDFNKTFLVLTEDGNTAMMEKLLTIHGIDLSKTKVESYDGKDNLASAIFFAKKLLDKSPNLKHILIHRDRDNENPQQLKVSTEKYLRSYELSKKATVLITKYYDIESYFLNERHVNTVYPEITRERALELIHQATKQTSETSKAKLRIAYSEYGKFGKMEDPQKKAEAINDLYEVDPEKYRYGKAVLYRLEELIAEELALHDKADLTRFSDHLRINEIHSCVGVLS